MSEMASAPRTPEYPADPQVQTSSEMAPMPDLIDYVREYARQKPEVVALWCFGVGFVLGWKLKPW